jgi:dienelactone hydrolase
VSTLQAIRVPAGGVELDGDLTLPERAAGVVLFAHGSGSSRHSIRNRYVAEILNDAGLATLLLDLLTPEEESVDDRTAHLRFDIELLAARLVAAADWPGAGGDKQSAGRLLRREHRRRRRSRAGRPTPGRGRCRRLPWRPARSRRRST